jgi:hypothetical protein
MLTQTTSQKVVKREQTTQIAKARVVKTKRIQKSKKQDNNKNKRSK